MAEHKLDRDYNGKTMLRTWWPKVDFNFASIYAWLMGHFNGTADRHKAEHIDYDSSATVKQKIDKEISDRQSGDNALQTKLNTEITNRQNADSTLDGKITAEVTNRQNADSELQGSIDTKADKVTKDGFIAGGATSNDNGGVAVGLNAKSGLTAVAVGAYSDAKDYGVSIGNNAKTDAGISIGYAALGDQNGIAIGVDSYAEGYESIAIGNEATAQNAGIQLGQCVSGDEGNKKRHTLQTFDYRVTDCDDDDHIFLADVGKLSMLNTEEKTDIVSAINWLKENLFVEFVNNDEDSTHCLFEYSGNTITGTLRMPNSYIVFPYTNNTLSCGELELKPFVADHEFELEEFSSYALYVHTDFAGTQAYAYTTPYPQVHNTRITQDGIDFRIANMDLYFEADAHVYVDIVAFLEAKVGLYEIILEDKFDSEIDGSKITPKTIDGDKIAANSITGGYAIETSGDPHVDTNGHIAIRTITGDNIDYSTIKGNNIGNKEIKTANIDDKGVTTGKIADKAVGTAQIADKAVTGQQIETKTITNWHMNDGAIQEYAIEDGAVTGRKIANGTITADKLASGVLGNSFADFQTSNVIRTGAWVDGTPMWRVMIPSLPMTRIVDNTDTTHAFTCEDVLLKLGVISRRNSSIEKVVYIDDRLVFQNDISTDLDCYASGVTNIAIGYYSVKGSDTENDYAQSFWGWIEFATPESNIKNTIIS